MGNKRVLVVVSHGSKQEASNQEFKGFIKKLEKINFSDKKNVDEKFSLTAKEESGFDLKTQKYAKIKAACLEFASPQLETVIKDLLRQEYYQIDILPLFIFAGYHVREDIPGRLQKLKDEFPNLNYQLLKHPAAASDFADYIFQKIIRNL